MGKEASRQGAPPLCDLALSGFSFPTHKMMKIIFSHGYEENILKSENRGSYPWNVTDPLENQIENDPVSYPEKRLQSRGRTNILASRDPSDAHIHHWDFSAHLIIH